MRVRPFQVCAVNVGLRWPVGLPTTPSDDSTACWPLLQMTAEESKENKSPVKSVLLGKGPEKLPESRVTGRLLQAPSPSAWSGELAPKASVAMQQSFMV